jgi:hypothetical protein
MAGSITFLLDLYFYICLFSDDISVLLEQIIHLPKEGTCKRLIWGYEEFIEIKFARGF